MNDELFQRFWLAGMRKCNKKKAKSLFNRLLKEKEYPVIFTNMLGYDIQERLKSNQLGFKEMHPTTYLNGERWEDEIVQLMPTKQSPMERLRDRSWADHMVNPQLLEK